MKKFTLLSIVLIISFSVTKAQWEQTTCPVAYTRALLVSGTNIFAGTISGVFLSTNNGISWTAVNSGLSNTNVNSLAVSGTSIFAGTTSGVFLSSNNGTSWENAGLTGFGINSLAISGTNIFASSTLNNGVFLSTNNGISWTPVNSGLSTLYPVISLTVSDSYVFAGTDGDGVFRSSNNGANWTAFNSGNTDWGIMSLAVNGADIFAGCFWGSVVLSTNYGNNWTLVSNGLYQTGEIFAFAVNGANIFAGTSFKGVYISTDNGTNWTAVNSGFPIIPFPNQIDIRSLVTDDIYLYAGTVLHGVWRRPLSEIITDVNETPSQIPDRYSLEQNFPNPFNPTTKISWQSPVGSWQTLKIYDILGNEIAELVNEEKGIGVYSVNFDASNLASGIYLYKIQAGNFVQTKKMILMK